jgi:kynurenine formamidase
MADDNWGRWGDDDERGALNLLTDEVVRAAADSITTGKAYNLGIPIQSQGVPLLDYRGTPQRLTLTNESDEGMYEFIGCPPGTGSHEDMLVFASHTTSHMDALCHVYDQSRHYNGFPASSMKTHTGAGHLGIQNVGAIAARMVMLDVVAHKAADGWLELGAPIGGADLQACAEAQGIEVGPGDVVLVRTGYLDAWNALQPGISFEQPGIDASAARWLAQRDVVAVGSDNAAVEVIPFDADEFLAVHKILLVQRGIYMVEFLNLADLAADRCYEGLITIAPLLVTGATGSPVNPVVIG